MPVLATVIMFSTCPSVCACGRAGILWLVCRRPLVFTTRRYASAVYAVVVCLSVRPSATSRYCIETTRRIELVFATGPFLHLYCVIRKFWYLRNNGTSLWNFVVSSWLEKFRQARRSCCQQNSPTVELVDTLSTDAIVYRRSVCGSRAACWNCLCLFACMDIRYFLPVEGGSVAEWLACWTQAQKGPGSNCSRDAVK